MSEKIKCSRCGTEINEYAYASVLIQSYVIVENERFPKGNELLYFCLKCYLNFNKIINLLKEVSEHD